MESSTLLTIFAGIVTVAFVAQCVAIWFVSRDVRRLAVRAEQLGSNLAETVEQLKEKIETLVSTVSSTAERLKALQENLTATSEVIHRRVVSVDRFLSETTESARMQIVRIQDAVDLACRRTERAIDLLYRGVIAPVSEAGAIINGLRAGLAILMRRAKGPVVRTSHQDEELFI